MRTGDATKFDLRVGDEVTLASYTVDADWRRPEHGGSTCITATTRVFVQYGCGPRNSLLLRTKQAVLQRHAWRRAGGMCEGGWNWALREPSYRLLTVTRNLRRRHGGSRYGLRGRDRGRSRAGAISS